jgi:hypothetical protein
MKLRKAIIAGTMMLLAGCGVADQYSALPKIFRQPGVAVSRPRRVAGRGFDVCVKAVVPGAIDGEPRPVTVLVTIEHGKLTERHRATSQDRCAADTYEIVRP